MIGLLFAAAISAMFVITAINYGTFNDENYLLMFGLPLAIGAIFPLIVFITMLFSLRIRNGIVQSMLLGRWVLNEANLNDLTTVEVSIRGPAVILHFTGGIKIKLWAAHMSEIKRLMADLKQSSPNTKFIIPAILKPIYENLL